VTESCHLSVTPASLHRNECHALDSLTRVAGTSQSTRPVAQSRIDAIVLADAAGADARVVGLTLAERARRVAGRGGATRVLIARERTAITAWWNESGRGDAVLVIRATDQLVHTPLVSGLATASGDRVVAVAPDGAVATDVAAGAYAGAMLARGAAADELVAALARGDDDRALGAAALAAGATAVPHGEVARHPATTRAERKAAAKLLYRIIHKTQDNAITRYLYRPVSFPLTRALVHTPVTPNQVSYAVGVLVIIGIWLTARGPMWSAIAGTALCLFASYVDCCDGEIARLKLLSSKFGAWLDTIIDELSQIGYMAAVGWHCRKYFGVDYLGHLGFDPWIWAIVIGTISYALTIYIVYFNIIVVVGSANSQDYVGRFEVVDGAEPNTVRLRPAATQAIATDNMHPAVKWVATYLPYIVRKDFISWGALILAALHLTQVAFAMLVLGGPVTAIIVGVDHLKLRMQLRAIARRGARIIRPA
jgi:phosphatidylglycerophosphate synthase